MILLIIIKRDSFSSEEKKKKDGTHVAKFQKQREAKTARDF